MTGERVEVVIEGADQLGEGPVWTARDARLSRVDIGAGLLKVLDPSTGSETRTTLGGRPGFALPRAAGGVVAGVDRRLVLLPGGRVLGEVEHGREHNRFNDAACDAHGRLWAGTMSMVRAPGAAALYRIGRGGDVSIALDGIGISNGLDWSLDGATLYYVDSLTQRVDAIDFDVVAGRLGERRQLIRIEPEDGLPDGLAVDAEGGIWLALFGGAAIRRYTPEGALERVVRLPVTNPTSLAFGGAALDELYVTSARHLLSPEQLAREPLAGSLLRLRPGVAGRETHAFAG